MSDYSTVSPPATKPNDPLGSFPAGVRTDHAAFLQHGDLDAADRAVIVNHLPDQSAPPAGGLRDEHKFISDLGFDSLAIAEVVFFLEDLYRVRINQQDLQRIATVGDLRAYVRRELATAKSA